MSPFFFLFLFFFFWQGQDCYWNTLVVDFPFSASGHQLFLYGYYFLLPPHPRLCLCVWVVDFVIVVFSLSLSFCWRHNYSYITCLSSRSEYSFRNSCMLAFFLRVYMPSHANRVCVWLTGFFFRLSLLLFHTIWITFLLGENRLKTGSAWPSLFTLSPMAESFCRKSGQGFSCLFRILEFCWFGFWEFSCYYYDALQYHVIKLWICYCTLLLIHHAASSFLIYHTVWLVLVVQDTI